MATSPGGDSAPPKLTEKDGKTMQRLTLGEAAEEIKRLRRLARQNKVDLQKKEEEKGQLEQTVSELQAEMQTAQRAAEKRIREKEREADDLRKQLDKAAEDMRFLQTVSLPINEARKLTYKALRKGRALECLGELFCRNSVTNRMLREGFTAIVENAFGLGHLAFRAEHGVGPSCRTAVESQLRLLRQEQLLLLAENDRLTTQLSEVQGALATQRKDAANQPQEEAEIEKAEASASGGDTDTDKNPQSAKSRKKAIKAAFELVASLLRTARVRLLAVAMQRLACYAIHETGVMLLDVARTKATNNWNQVNFILGAKLILIFLRAFMRRREQLGFYRLWENAIKDKGVTKEPEKTTTGRNLDPAADLALPYPGESLSPHLLGLSLAGAGGPLGGLPPFVYQPHYYGRLPSTQTRRSGNVFYPAPPAPTGQAELKRQALCHNTDVCDPIYRPAPELSASAQVNRGFNSVDPSGFLPGLASSREMKVRRRELQGALLKRSAFPDEEPLSATQMNDMYIDMLLEEVDKRQ
ncbi:UNVERIFIED_CONTAM: hypothetical protein HHA_274160 [Hammondia hammondi]|eukprot:XP_008882720.1 hypothetical protein HHA_274160 [Hammondia hammondi]